MPVAIGASLAVLGLNSVAGFVAHLGVLQLDLTIAGVFLGTAAVTALAAGRLAGRLPERVLRQGFAGLALAVGVFVAAQAALGHVPAPS